MEGLKGIKDIQPSIVFQPLYPEFITHSKTKGGNAMGLEVDPSKGMLIRTHLLPPSLLSLPPHLPTQNTHTHTHKTQHQKPTTQLTNTHPPHSILARLPLVVVLRRHAGAHSRRAHLRARGSARRRNGAHAPVRLPELRGRRAGRLRGVRGRHACEAARGAARG